MNSRGRTTFVEGYCQSLFKPPTRPNTSTCSGPSFGSKFTALRMKDGGIQPIAVGKVFRRLASKIASKRVIPELWSQLPPVQLGVGGGCEAAAHSVRAFDQSAVVHGNNVLVKLDMQNAFNAVRRDHFLKVCSSTASSMLRLALTAYATCNHLVIGNETITSEIGVQKGDPLGPVLFALAVDVIVKHHILAIDEAS